MKILLHTLGGFVFLFISPSVWAEASEPPPTLAQELSNKIQKLQSQWMFSNLQGVFTGEVKEKDIQEILIEIERLKRQAEYTYNNTGFSEENRRKALLEYLAIYEGWLQGPGAKTPTSIRDLNQKLAIRITKNQPVDSLKSLLSDFYTNPLSSYHVERSSKDYRISMSSNFIQALIESLEFKKSQRKEFKTKDKLLFMMGKRLILKELQISEDKIEKLLGTAPQTPQQKEMKFREALSHFAVQQTLNQEFQREGIGNRWVTDEFLMRLDPILTQDTSANPDNISALRDYFSLYHTQSLPSAWPNFILGAHEPLTEKLQTQNIHDFLCLKYKEFESLSLLWALDVIVQLNSISTRQLEDMQNLANTFFKKNSSHMKCPDFLNSKFISVPLSNFLKEKSWEKKESTLHKDIQNVLKIYKEGVANQPIDPGSLMKFFQYKIQVVEQKNLSVTALGWINNLGSSNLSYVSLIDTYNNLLEKQKAMTQNSLLQSLRMWDFFGKQVEDNLSVLNQLGEFLKAHSTEPIQLNRDLNFSDQDLETLREFWFLDQKEKFPILNIKLDGKELFPTDDSQWRVGTLNQGLEEMKRKIKEAQNEAHSWKNIEEMNSLIKNSSFLRDSLTLSSVSPLTYQSLRDQMNPPNLLLESIRSFSNTYFSGFLALIGLQLSRFAMKFKYPKVASFIGELLLAIPAKVLHYYVIAGFPLIGVHLIYEGHHIFGEKKDELNQVNRFALTSPIITPGEQDEVEQNFEVEKTLFYIHAGLTGVFFVLPSALFIPRVREKFGKFIYGWQQKRMRKLDQKIKKHFKKIGIHGNEKAYTWNPQVLDDIYQLRFVELRRQTIKTEYALANQIPQNKLKNKRTFRKFLSSLSKKDQEEILHLYQNHSQSQKALKDIQASKAYLNRFYSKQEKLWTRYGQEYRIDFQRIGLEPGNWNWKEIRTAFLERKKIGQQRGFSPKELEELEESYQRLMTFLYQKAVNYRGYESLRELLPTVLKQLSQPSGSFTHPGTDFILAMNKEVSFGYRVIQLKGFNQEVIVPQFFKNLNHAMRY